MKQDRDGLDAIEIGDGVVVERTIAESDVYLFAGITGDDHPNHLNEEYMKTGRFGKRIVQGAYLVGCMNAGSTRFLIGSGIDGVSYGYNKIRFINPVFIGDTVQVDYRISSLDHSNSRAIATVKVRNQDGTIVAAGEHVLAFIR